jgi:RecJ-like exonuclease
MDIQDLSEVKGRKPIDLAAVVDGVAQTGGPTLFTLNDGTGSFVVKAFDGPGVRAYPDIVEGDCVNVLASLKEFEGKLEGEIIKVKKVDEAEAKKIKDKIVRVLKERAQPKDIPFMVKSQTLDKLKKSFTEAAAEIRMAVMNNRPVVIRHHNDTDGYCSGYTMEKAILPLVEKQHGEGRALVKYFTRSPISTPFYELEDSIRDTTGGLMGFSRFSEKMPLIVIVDTGSSPESLLGIQQGKVHGIDFIVVDHHFSEKDLISAETLVHVNPFLVGEDGAKFSAGMLCAELARFINPDIDVDYIPAMAAFADMIKNPEVVDAYVKLAEKKGYNPELLGSISAVIDFVATKLRFMEAREYVEVLFGEPIAKQKKLVDLLRPVISKMEETSFKLTQSAAKIEECGKVKLQLLFIEETLSRGVYPKPGKANGMLHDVVSKKKGNESLVSAGVLTDAITMRATEPSGFDIHAFIKYCEENVPMAFVNGGGHKHAGAVRFVPSRREEVLDALRKFLKK